MQHSGKSYLYLGSGDFSAPLAKALKHSQPDQQKIDSLGVTRDSGEEWPAHARSLNPGYSVTATELHSREETIERQNKILEKDDSYFPLGNIYDITNIGGNVVEGFDATNYPYETGSYDRIIFMNPHTDLYGSKYDGGLKDSMAVQSNKSLLNGVLNAAKWHLRHGGKLQIHVCGWPFITEYSRNQKYNIGLHLDVEILAQEYAKSQGWKLVGHKWQGERVVRRNNGDGFRANVLKLSFQPLG